ncbi:MAG: Gx transporter family protein [Oscillospiraceae bacterium]
MKVQTLARLSMLTAVALALGYVESFIPVAPGIPGIKLGLANTVLLYSLYLLDVKSSVLLMLFKVLLSGLLYAGFSATMFSLGGGVLSLLMMILTKKFIKNISIVGVSVIGAVFHNVGQLAVAATVVSTVALLSYLPVLLVSAVITGVLTGIAANVSIRALSHGKIGGGGEAKK